jgi:hypothetical protein
MIGSQLPGGEDRGGDQDYALAPVIHVSRIPGSLFVCLYEICSLYEAHCYVRHNTLRLRKEIKDFPAAFR